MPQFAAFLSHNSADKPAVRFIREELHKRGLSCWMDENDLPTGVDWVSQIETALGESECCVIFYGPSGIGPWHEIERQLAQFMAVEAWRQGRHFGIIPVRLPGAPEWRQLALPPFLRLYTVVDFPEQLSDAAALDRLQAGITQAVPPPADLDPSRPPYIGMRPYLEADSALFSGRNNYIVHLAAALARAEAPRFFAVLGASGSGKSSLVNAGLLPRLRAGSLHRETSSWLYVTLRPGANAWSNLRAALAGQPELLSRLTM